MGDLLSAYVPGCLISFEINSYMLCSHWPDNLEQKTVKHYPLNAIGSPNLNYMHSGETSQ